MAADSSNFTLQQFHQSADSVNDVIVRRFAGAAGQSESGADPSKSGGVADFDALMPSILQCFSIIIAGFLTRKIRLIDQHETKGLRILLVYFLAPCMMTQCLLYVRWDAVNWKFLACCFASKAFVFAAVSGATLLLSNDFGKSGLYGIFTTQSNDMALGYPIALALYSTAHVDYPRYIYLLMPVNLMVLNPIGFFMMELERRRRSSNSTGGLTGLILSVIKGVLINPMVISTVIGILGNIVIQRIALPKGISVVLGGFAEGFVPVALFTLGCTLVSQEKPDLHCPVATALLLTLAKILLLPLILHELVSAAHIGKDALETSSLSTFGFLYGSLPTAPTVFVYSSLFNIATGQIAVGLALCTFLSAPWLYLSCRMISVKHISLPEQQDVLRFTGLHANLVGLVAAITCIVIFCVTRKFLRLPQRFVFCFLIWSVIMNIFAIQLLFFNYDEFLTTTNVSVYALICIFVVYAGEWGFRIVTALVATSLVILRCVGLCRLIKYSKIFIIIGFMLPITFSTLLFLSVHDFKAANVSTILEHKSAVFSIFIDLFVVITSVVLIIVQYGLARRQNNAACSHILVKTTNDDEDDPDADDPRERERPSVTRISAAAAYRRLTDIPEPLDIEDTVVAPPMTQPTTISSAATISSAPKKSAAAADLSAPGPAHPTDDDDELDENDSEDLIGLDLDEASGGDQIRNHVMQMCPPSASCSIEQRYRCKKLLQRYRRRTEMPNALVDVDEIDEFPEIDAHELTKHSIFVALLCVSAVLNLFVNVWKLVGVDLISGTYVQLKLLDSVVTYAQALICLGLFGCSSTIWNKVLKRIRKLFYGTNKLVLPDKLDLTSKLVCDQFSRYHLTACARDINKTIRYPLKIYRNVFRGSALVDWLVANGLSEDRFSAIRFGRRLILGKIIQHIHQEEHFYDSSLLYRFVVTAHAQQPPSAINYSAEHIQS